MAFRMSEQARTIKIYNLLAGTNEFIGEGDAYIPPHTGLPANSTDIAPPDIPAGFVAVFNIDEDRGISLKTIGEKPSMTWLPATRYLFLNLAHYRKMSPVIPGRGVSEVERHSPGERCRSRKTVPDPRGGRNKNSLMQVASEHIAPLQDAVDLEIATEEETSLLEARKSIGCC